MEARPNKTMDKLLKYLVLVLITTLSVTFTSCGDDGKDEPNKDDPNQEEVDVQLYGGTWKCIPTSEQKKHEYPYSFSFNKNGSFTAMWLESDGDMEPFSGSWELTGRYLNIIAIFRDDFDDDVEAEEWTCKVITLTQSELMITFEGEIFTFIR